MDLEAIAKLLRRLLAKEAAPQLRALVRKHLGTVEAELERLAGGSPSPAAGPAPSSAPVSEARIPQMKEA